MYYPLDLYSLFFLGQKTNSEWQCGVFQCAKLNRCHDANQYTYVSFPTWSLWLQRFAEVLRKLRRAGKIGEFVSVHVNPKHVRGRVIVYFDVSIYVFSFSIFGLPHSLYHVPFSDELELFVQTAEHPNCCWWRPGLSTTGNSWQGGISYQGASYEGTKGELNEIALSYAPMSSCLFILRNCSQSHSVETSRISPLQNRSNVGRYIKCLRKVWIFISSLIFTSICVHEMLWFNFKGSMRMFEFRMVFALLTISYAKVLWSIWMWMRRITAWYVF